MVSPLSVEMRKRKNKKLVDEASHRSGAMTRPGQKSKIQRVKNVNKKKVTPKMPRNQGHNRRDKYSTDPLLEAARSANIAKQRTMSRRRNLWSGNTSGGSGHSRAFFFLNPPSQSSPLPCSILILLKFRTQCLVVRFVVAHCKLNVCKYCHPTAIAQRDDDRAGRIIDLLIALVLFYRIYL